MTKFYFTAVSTSAKKKLVGSFTAEDEKSARERINKAGMAILSFATEPPAEWHDAFEFSAREKNGNEFAGELLAESDEAVFDRLANEFDFAKINYIFAASAGEEEKLRARENSVREIIARKKKKEEQKNEFEKRTISGGFKSLVKIGEEKKPSKLEENLKKFSDANSENSAESETAAPEKSAAEDIPPTESAGQKIDSAPPDFPAEEINWRARLDKIKNTFVSFFPTFSEKFGKFYFHATEIIVPPKDKTRADGWREMKKFLFPPRELRANTQSTNEKVLRRKMIFQKFWSALEEIVDLLAAVFIAYLALGVTALFVAIPRISALAESTLRGNFTIHYLAGAFIFVRILILLREKFTSWSFVRTTLLFFCGGLVLFFAGINLL